MPDIPFKIPLSLYNLELVGTDDKTDKPLKVLATNDYIQIESLSTSITYLHLRPIERIPDFFDRETYEYEFVLGCDVIN